MGGRNCCLKFSGLMQSLNLRSILFIESLKVLRSKQAEGFILLKERWLVERTFGWLNWYHRLSKGHEYLLESSEMIIYITVIRFMIRRLVEFAPSETFRTIAKLRMRRKIAIVFFLPVTAKSWMKAINKDYILCSKGKE